MAGPAQRFEGDPAPDDPHSQPSTSTPLIDHPDVTAPTPPDGQVGHPEGSGLKTEAPGAEPPKPLPPAEGPPPGQATRPSRGKGGFGFVRELPFLLLIAFVLALLIKTFLVQAFYIPSESMVPTLNVGDRVLVNKVVYRLHPPRRGDIIVFSDPNPPAHAHRNPVSAVVHWLTDGLGVTTSPNKDFIKRVIGLPGEEVEMHQCIVYINGQALKEPYLNGAKFNNCEYNPVHVPSNSLFVMGDNRDNSNDSRFQLGFIPEDKVVGRAFVIIWPPSRISLLHGF